MLIDASKCVTASNEEVGPLTDAFKEFLHEMWRSRNTVVSPRDLFSQISKKWQQFRGWRQQDSQELMRFLFDGIKIEELEVRISLRTTFTTRVRVTRRIKMLFKMIFFTLEWDLLKSFSSL